jgi:hypothetical protein
MLQVENAKCETQGSRIRERLLSSVQPPRLGVRSQRSRTYVHELSNPGENACMNSVFVLTRNCCGVSNGRGDGGYGGRKHDEKTTDLYYNKIRRMVRDPVTEP